MRQSLEVARGKIERGKFETREVHRVCDMVPCPRDKEVGDRATHVRYTNLFEYQRQKLWRKLEEMHLELSCWCIGNLLGLLY